MNDTILVTREGALARVTLNRPASLNAMDFDMAVRWKQVAEEITTDDSIGAVILDAAGRAFCAGGDVVAMQTSGRGGAAITEMADDIHEGIRMFVESDKPMVASVRGAVAGGGLGLMLTADYIVAGEDASFTSKYANIGLTPDLSASTTLVAAIGERRALQMFLQDIRVDAATALDWGLVAEVVADPAARAAEVAQFWLDGAIGAFGQAKRLVRVGRSRSFAENLADEARTIGARFDTDEARVRVEAFVARTTQR